MVMFVYEAQRVEDVDPPNKVILRPPRPRRGSGFPLPPGRLSPQHMALEWPNRWYIAVPQVNSH